MSPSSSAYSSGRRWRPTPQQLMVLHELYRRGLINPNASEIQRITAHLSCYGWIQGKNVFYWFQNHKARERQKLRKKQQQQLSKQLHQPHLPQLYHYHHHHLHQQQQLINTTSTSHSDDDFRRHQLFNCYSSSPHHQELFSQQGTADQGMMNRHQTVGDDLSTDCVIRIDGRRDLVCCRNNRPMETLELFPLRPPTV